MVLLLLLLAASSSTFGNKLFVVVHIVDGVVMKYVCPQRIEMGDPRAVREVVRQEPFITWHATGGVRPYTLLSQRTDRAGNICITVMDAAGQIATGCGIMSTWIYTSQTNCPDLPSEETHVVYKSPEDCDRTIVRATRDPVAPPPVRRPIMERERNREPGAGTRSTYTERPVVKREPVTNGGGGSGGTVYKRVTR